MVPIITRINRSVDRASQSTREDLKTARSARGRIHFPCERVSLESVVRMCITELEVEPRREDWAKVLTMNEDAFETYRTWPPQPKLGTQPD